MSATHRPTVLRVIAPLLLAFAACDAPDSEPSVELREGQTVQFKTTSSDQSFTWKGCEPPWGPDPYPNEQWLSEASRHIERDLAANALSSFHRSEASRECDEGCARLELGWSGDAMPSDTKHGLGKVNPLGHCDKDLVAVEIDVEVDTAFECSCS
ncbi:MAG TPA: hypothetical protein VG755_00660 [Nannocystaceae bacterium]|nr:hypothetical protein [Nannocystaceae bacterium]